MPGDETSDIPPSVGRVSALRARQPVGLRSRILSVLQEATEPMPTVSVADAVQSTPVLVGRELGALEKMKLVRGELGRWMFLLPEPAPPRVLDVKRTDPQGLTDFRKLLEESRKRPHPYPTRTEERPPPPPFRALAPRPRRARAPIHQEDPVTPPELELPVTSIQDELPAPPEARAPVDPPPATEPVPVPEPEAPDEPPSQDEPEIPWPEIPEVTSEASTTSEPAVPAEPALPEQEADGGGGGPEEEPGRDEALEEAEEPEKLEEPDEMEGPEEEATEAAEDGDAPEDDEEIGANEELEEEQPPAGDPEGDEAEEQPEGDPEDAEDHEALDVPGPEEEPEEAPPTREAGSEAPEWAKALSDLSPEMQTLGGRIVAAVGRHPEGAGGKTILQEARMTCSYEHGCRVIHLLVVAGLIQSLGERSNRRLYPTGVEAPGIPTRSSRPPRSARAQAKARPAPPSGARPRDPEVETTEDPKAMLQEIRRLHLENKGLREELSRRNVPPIAAPAQPQTSESLRRANADLAQVHQTLDDIDVEPGTIEIRLAYLRGLLGGLWQARRA